jgi:uncharacterized protein
MQIHTFRLKPGQDLFNEIEAFIMEKKVEAGCILSSVGSLTRATLRLADQSHSSEYAGHFEILSLNGTVATSGLHLHISISDGDGQTIGGHLVSGSKVYATAGIVIAEFEGIIYRREFAEDSGYEELAVYKK